LIFLYNDNNFNSYQKGQLIFTFNKLIAIYVLEKLQYLISIISSINLSNIKFLALYLSIIKIWTNMYFYIVWELLEDLLSVIKQ